ncbi:probable calcium-binding protein CML41 [Cornus florida]|uniref:probable calcium-binding protein CML41 n=1 Tax=Cornus florida TaxID=4283 RepID=UPI002897399A|nr:probable calcium-binding protein CML41 [Cornus florida]
MQFPLTAKFCYAITLPQLPGNFIPLSLFSNFFFFVQLYKSSTFCSFPRYFHIFPPKSMEPLKVPKLSFGCFLHKGLKLSTLPRLRSKSSSTLSSPSSSNTSPITPKSTASWEDELREVFRHFDRDNDGKISAIELRAYFGSVGEYMSHEEAQGVIDDLDTDGDSSIDFQDFMRLMKREGGGGCGCGGGDQDDLKAAFEMFEFEKGSGYITPKSLQRVLNRLGDSKSYDECVAMIQVFDTDGNGELDFHEFRQMMA